LMIFLEKSVSGVLSDKGELLSTRCTLDREGRGSAHERMPLSKGSWASFLIGLAIDEVAFQCEVVVDVGVYGCEFL